MNIIELHEQLFNDIVADVFTAISRAHRRSCEKAGTKPTQQRLKALYGHTVCGVNERNLSPIIADAEFIAQERSMAGFDLSEIQTAFNVLEEAIWVCIMKELPPEEQAEALGLVSTVLGAGKDASLASKSKASSLDLRSLFSGIAGS